LLGQVGLYVGLELHLAAIDFDVRGQVGDAKLNSSRSFQVADEIAVLLVFI